MAAGPLRSAVKPNAVGARAWQDIRRACALGRKGGIYAIEVYADHMRVVFDKSIAQNNFSSQQIPSDTIGQEDCASGGGSWHGRERERAIKAARAGPRAERGAAAEHHQEGGLCAQEIWRGHLSSRGRLAYPFFTGRPTGFLCARASRVLHGGRAQYWLW